MQRRSLTFRTCLIHRKVRNLQIVVMLLAIANCSDASGNCKLKSSVRMSNLVFWRTGRVKNPDFLKEVSSACKKEDHIIVVT